MKYIDRKDLPDWVQEWIGKESHHDHKIIEDEHGTLRWEQDEKVDYILNQMNLNDVVVLFQFLGWGKNSEQYRELYRKMGYSLGGYWEIFHWEVNNPDLEEYQQKVLEVFKREKKEV